MRNKKDLLPFTNLDFYTILDVLSTTRPLEVNSGWKRPTDGEH